MNDEAVVETDDVQVRKSFDADDFPVPAITFEVSSDRDDDVTVRIVDEIPDEFGIDQIGFHPDYGSEFWSATGDGVVRFERTVDAGESFTTVYGVRLEGEEAPDPFLTPPTVEVGDGLDDVVPPESTQVVRDLVSGDRDSVPGLEDTEEPSDDEEIIEAPSGPADAVGSGIADLEAEMADESEGEREADAGSETADESERTPADAAAEMDADVGTDRSGSSADAGASEAGSSADDAVAEAAPTPAAGGDPVAALADAIRSGEADEDDLAVVREELGVSDGTRSTEVKVEHLQSRVSDLEAYADALEAFIDENGTAEELLADLEADVGEVDDSLGDVEDRVATLESENEALRATLEDVEGEVAELAGLEEDLERLAGDLEALDERVADVEEVAFELEDLADDVEAIRDDVEDLEAWREQLSSVMGSGT